VLNEVHVPFLVRRRHDGRYSMLGECYIFGVMPGQVVELDMVAQEVVVLV
jgi:hypothetical protein